MSRLRSVGFFFLSAAVLTAMAQTVPVTVAPANMRRIGSVDERFQSYNVEMVEVVGGRFWKPYTSAAPNTTEPQQSDQSGATPTGMDPNLYQYRPPIDLSNPRLRRLAAALGPAYVRVSGTWANSVYFDNAKRKHDSTGRLYQRPHPKRMEGSD